MKRAMTMIFLVALTSMAAAVFAAGTNPGPEVIRLKMGDLVLPFKHWKHQKQLDSECFYCHATTGAVGKIEDWSKDTAHTICISCHELNNKGPVKCKECHDTVYSKK